MSTFIVIGTPASGLESIWSTLQAAGVKPALPSRKHNLAPAEINQKLAAMLGGNSPNTVDSTNAQITPPELWQGLFLDLVLSNAEEPCWGWADSQALYFANHWQLVNPDTKFLLVFGNPGLEAAYSSAGELSASMLEEAAKTWCAYNSALLAFYSKNKNKCLLVHGQQVLQSPGQLLEQLGQRLGKNLTAPTAPALKALVPETERATYSLSIELFEPGSEARVLYEELQACADLPYDDSDQENCLAAFNSYRGTVRENTSLLIQLHQVQEEFERHYLENEKLKDQENTLLLIQLHQVQEELERYYVENEKLKNKFYPSRKKQVQGKGNKPIGAAERVKQQLSYRLGATLLANSKSVSGILTLPWALMAQAKEFKLDQKKLAGKKLPPLKDYADADKAEQVKQHLSYRLGAVLIEHSKSPISWLTLPFALKKEADAFAHSRKVK